MLRRALAVALVLVVCVTTALWAYHRYLRPFRIAVVQFSDTDWVGWESAGLRTSYSMHRFELKELEAISLANYNLIVIRAMGLNLTDEQVRRFAEARSLGTHFLMIVPTNDRAREQNSLSEEHQQVVDEYLKQGGEDNLAGMLNYLAREIGGKEVAVPEPIEKPQDGFFPLGDAVFETLAQYEAFLDRDRPGLPDDAPPVALIGAFLDPRDTHNRVHVDDILQSLESQGTRVYPMFGQRTVLEQLEAVAPDLAIVFPHGRLAMGQSVIEVLERLDCPCVSALAPLSNEADWMADECGMAGNFLSQSITTPELDGVIEPIAITALEPNERDIDVRTPISERIDKRLRLALNWLKLRRKPNAEKRVVIVYYKGPGLAALSAGGLEVVPSLYNTLKRLQAEGYDLGDQMPASPEELQQLIQRRGKTLGQWASAPTSSSWRRPTLSSYRRTSTRSGFAPRFRKSGNVKRSSCGDRFPENKWPPNATTSPTWSSAASSWATSSSCLSPLSAVATNRTKWRRSTVRTRPCRTSTWARTFGRGTDSRRMRSFTSALTARSSSPMASPPASAAIVGPTYSWVTFRTSIRTSSTTWERR